MKKRIVFGALVACGATLAIVATALGSAGKHAARSDLPASSCSKLQYKGSGSPQYIVASDLPLEGAGRAQPVEMTKAIAYMFNQQGWKAGKYTLGYQSCDDATAQQGGWDSAKCTSNANAYAQTSNVLAVIGTFNSGCAKLEIPIANRAPGGPLAMVSPANTYPGLTVGGPGTAPGEPNVYYPKGIRNYARVVWTDQFQGAADAIFAKTRMKATKVFVLNDKQTYGLGVATLFRNAARKLGLKVVGFQSWDAKATSYESLVSAIKASGANAVFLGGIICNNGGKLIKDLRAGLGANVKLLGPDGFTPFSAVASTSGQASNGMYISYPGIPIKALKGAGKKFVQGFSKVVGKTPDPYSAYAAQAAQVVLNAIAKSDGTRLSVTKGITNVKVVNGILGNFSIDANGDTTLGTVTFGQMSGNTAKFVALVTPSVKLAKGK